MLSRLPTDKPFTAVAIICMIVLSVCIVLSCIIIVPMYIIQSEVDGLTPFDSWQEDFEESELIASLNWKKLKVFKTITKLYPNTMHNLSVQMKGKHIRNIDRLLSFESYDSVSYVFGDQDADSFSEEEDLVVVTPAEMGFKNGAYLYAVYERASKLGLKLCQIEDAAYFALQYTDLPTDGEIYIGMKPVITDGFSEGEYCMCTLSLEYNLRNQHDLEFVDRPASFNTWYSPDDRIIFILPRDRPDSPPVVGNGLY